MQVQSAHRHAQVGDARVQQERGQVPAAAVRGLCSSLAHRLRRWRAAPAARLWHHEASLRQPHLTAVKGGV